MSGASTSHASVMYLWPIYVAKFSIYVNGRGMLRTMPYVIPYEIQGHFRFLFDMCLCKKIINVV